MTDANLIRVILVCGLCTALPGENLRADLVMGQRLTFSTLTSPVFTAPESGLYTIHGEATGRGTGSSDPVASLLVNGSAIEVARADRQYVGINMDLTLPYSATIPLNAGDTVSVLLANWTAGTGIAPADLNILQYASDTTGQRSTFSTLTSPIFTVPESGLYTIHGEARGQGTGSDPSASLLVNGSAIEFARADGNYVGPGMDVTLPYSATIPLNAGDTVSVQLGNWTAGTGIAPADLNILQYTSGTTGQRLTFSTLTSPVFTAPESGLYTIHGEARGQGTGSDPSASLLVNGSAIEFARADGNYVGPGMDVTLPYSATIPLNAGDTVSVQLGNWTAGTGIAPADLNIIQHAIAAIPEASSILACALFGALSGVHLLVKRARADDRVA